MILFWAAMAPWEGRLHWKCHHMDMDNPLIGWLSYHFHSLPNHILNLPQYHVKKKPGGIQRLQYEKKIETTWGNRQGLDSKRLSRCLHSDLHSFLPSADAVASALVVDIPLGWVRKIGSSWKLSCLFWDNTPCHNSPWPHFGWWQTTSFKFDLYICACSSDPLAWHKHNVSCPCQSWPSPRLKVAQASFKDNQVCACCRLWAAPLVGSDPAKRRSCSAACEHLLQQQQWPAGGRSQRGGGRRGHPRPQRHHLL